MKKIIAIILATMILAGAVFAFSGCRKIQNDGSEDEVKGIYGVTTMFYKSFEGTKYNISGQFEYFMLVLNGDEGKTGKVIMKRVDEDELSYDITYSFKYNSDGKTVGKIVLHDFCLPEYNDADGAIRYSDPSSRELVFYPKHETLTFNLVQSNIDDGLKFNKNYFALKKFSNKVSDKKIKDVKQHQLNTLEARSKDPEADEIAGTYGLEKMYFVKSGGENVVIGGKFDYYIVALNDDNTTGKVIFKREGGEEEEYPITYSIETGEDETGNDVATSVKISGIKLPVLNVETGEFTFGDAKEITFICDSDKTDRLTYSENGENGVVIVIERGQLYTSNISIERVKTDQKNEKENRS